VPRSRRKNILNKKSVPVEATGEYKAWDSISDGTHEDEVLGTRLQSNQNTIQEANEDLPLTYTQYDKVFS